LSSADEVCADGTENLVGCFLDFSPGVAEELISVGDPFNRCVWWLLCLVEPIRQSLVKTAQSLPPESAGSR
jgi:hypothetical protein